MLRCFVVLCAVAAAAAQNEPMTDPRTGAMLYFDTAMGYYYDGNCNRYYDTTTDLYLDTYTNAWYTDPEGRCWDITTTGNTMMDPFNGNMLYYDDSKRMYYDITNNRYSHLILIVHSYNKYHCLILIVHSYNKYHCLILIVHSHTSTAT